jgi:hypothetical protein
MNDDGLAVMNAPAACERTANARNMTGSWLGWAPLILLPPLVLVLAPAGWPRWLVMWVLSVVIFAGCKWLTWWGTPATNAPVWLHLAYFLAWPGLDAVHFLDRGRRAIRQPGSLEWLFAASKLTLGLVLVFAVARLVPTSQPYLTGWIGMIGIVLFLHFGLFHLLSCIWRSVGIDAQPLMNWPLAAVSLSEFWSRRWNTAFRDLTHRHLFVPLTSWFGATGAVLVGFLFSGLVHDAVISLPAEGGYGGPTLFFGLQGVGLLLERTKTGRWLGLGKGWRGWLFTLLCLLVPAPLLFHLPFVTQVVVPFLRAIGAI